MSTDTPPDTSAAAVERVLAGLASMVATHPHFAAPLKAHDLICALSSQLEAARRDAERKVYLELYEALPLHTGVDSIRATLLRSEHGDYIREMASAGGKA
jgi:hypothetical protein